MANSAAISDSTGAHLQQRVLFTLRFCRVRLLLQPCQPALQGRRLRLCEAVDLVHLWQAVGSGLG